MPGDRDRVLREIRRRKIAVVGLGVSNQALLRFLLGHGARNITAGDAKTAEAFGPASEWLAGLPIGLRMGPGYLDILADAEIIFLTPGIRKDLPEIAAARARGAEISSEIGLLLDLVQARTVGVTASAGKTTTTTLVGDMLGRSGRRVFVGGNIGTPLIERCLGFGPDDTIVLELSSFQLQLVGRSPEVGAVLNVAPNHLDVHRDYEEYVTAKKGMYRYQEPGDWAVFGADNPESLAMARDKLSWGSGGVALFGKGEPPAALDGQEVGARAWVDGEWLVAAFPEGVAPGGRGADGPAAGGPGAPAGGAPRRAASPPQRICRVADVRLRGEHNLLNLLAATLVTVLAGGRLEAASQVATTFETIEHRLEPVVEVNGVAFVNDSIGTAPDRTEVALASFPGPIHIILGGSDKRIPFDTLARSIVGGGKVRKAILMGATGPKIRRALEEAIEGRAGVGAGVGASAAQGAGPPVLIDVGSLDEAVREAFEGAVPGTTVLFSPACASFDMFHDYKERGRAFKDAARKLAASVR